MAGECPTTLEELIKLFVTSSHVKAKYFLSGTLMAEKRYL
jgi:hypothetical protein